MELEDLPIVGKFLTVLAGVLEIVVHGGELVFALFGGLLSVFFGSPEILVGLIGTLRRLEDLIGIPVPIPADVLNYLLAIALFAMLTIYAGRLANHVTKKS